MFSDEISGSCQIEVITLSIGMAIQAELASVPPWMIQFIAKWHLANFCMHEKETAYYQDQLGRKRIYSQYLTHISKQKCDAYVFPHSQMLIQFILLSCFIIQMLKLCIMISNSIGPLRIGHGHHRCAKFGSRDMARTQFLCLKGRDFSKEILPKLLYVIFLSRAQRLFVIVQQLTEVIQDYINLSNIFKDICNGHNQGQQSHCISLF